MITPLAPAEPQKAVEEASLRMPIDSISPRIDRIVAAGKTVDDEKRLVAAIDGTRATKKNADIAAVHRSWW